MFFCGGAFLLFLHPIGKSDQSVFFRWKGEDVYDKLAIEPIKKEFSKGEKKKKKPMALVNKTQRKWPPQNRIYLNY